ncbi:MAG: class I SAM-dependent methyltransferase [Chloroflexi bacterium AL-W]|nr:class I SAM-dependent methyltransferase [Chloroflexi bacterium AL-N1]NOK65393.1 class I SAM-dependent methyltransferase [Chloroflexi bacterium AL-N10]NOK72341.1 class I SAM-dependent methyltransferase [Chloroflexi bacterium AL-N5]NOK79572.1 class I SAM-dependent methyltransferase [Chloroflexi bacterium AL-W]NOK87488.1 class I SAM-dependent methyltransferase [Chloroflexi bacterium AL-N15]
MLAWAIKRAIRTRVTDHVTFACADIQQLPFRDNRFDAVICESVLAFPPDKHQAIRECLRVVRLGGYVGLNEVTWVHDTPPDDVVAYVHQALAHADF